MIHLQTFFNIQFMMPKFKHCLLLVVVSWGFIPAGFSQNQKIKDTLPTRDTLVEILKEGNKVTGAVFETDKKERLTIRAKVVIDATDLGDGLAMAGAFAVMLGMPFFTA